MILLYILSFLFEIEYPQSCPCRVEIFHQMSPDFSRTPRNQNLHIASPLFFQRIRAVSRILFSANRPLMERIQPSLLQNNLEPSLLFPQMLRVYVSCAKQRNPRTISRKALPQRRTLLFNRRTNRLYFNWFGNLFQKHRAQS